VYDGPVTYPGYIKTLRIPSKGRSGQTNLSLFFIYRLKKAYDNVNRDKLWEMMDNKIPNYLHNKIKCIYRNTKVRIKFNNGIF
jgi:hypothetical protein